MTTPPDAPLADIPARPLGRVLSAPQFWALMEKWRVSDPVALDLIAFPGKMPRTGKRPRFRLLSSQQRLTGYLAAVDDALEAAGYDSAWLHRKAKGFGGLSPIDLMIRDGTDGAAKVLRVLTRAVLKKALTS